MMILLPFAFLFSTVVLAQDPGDVFVATGTAFSECILKQGGEYCAGHPQLEAQKDAFESAIEYCGTKVKNWGEMKMVYHFQMYEGNALTFMASAQGVFSCEGKRMAR